MTIYRICKASDNGREPPEQSPVRMLLDLILMLNIALNCLRISLVCSRGAYNAGTEPGSKPYEEGIGLMVCGININFCLAFHRKVCLGTWSGMKHWFMYHQLLLVYLCAWSITTGPGWSKSPVLGILAVQGVSKLIAVLAQFKGLSSRLTVVLAVQEFGRLIGPKFPVHAYGLSTL